jgi:hypothetical protein
LEKLPKVNKRSIGENSPNLVALALIKPFYHIVAKKEFFVNI